VDRDFSLAHDLLFFTIMRQTQAMRPWQIDRMFQDLFCICLHYAIGAVERNVLDRAWEEWLAGVEECDGFDYRLEECEPDCFLPWLFFDWVNPRKTRSGNPDRRTIVDRVLKAWPRLVPPEGKEIVRSALREPNSFYELVTYGKGKPSVLRDLMTDRVFEVAGKPISHKVEAGTFFYGKVVPADCKAIVLAHSEVTFSPEQQTAIAELRKDLSARSGRPLRPEDLRRHEREMRVVYRKLRLRAIDEFERSRAGKESGTVGASSRPVLVH
jgi:hypothetical protein